jgi:hypothetical protein
METAAETCRAQRVAVSRAAGRRRGEAKRELATTTANCEAPPTGLWKEREHAERRPQFAA